jgi:biopolymer transport protein ExbD
MPVKLSGKLPADSAEARIEIIPLIDIMFFLLAAFMLVSLSMVNLKSIKVNLPTSTSAATDAKKDFLDLSVSASGLIYLDKKRLSDPQLVWALSAALAAKPDVRILLSGDRDARHGDIIHALDLVRAAGIDKVAFEISTPSPPSASSTATTPPAQATP